MPCSGCSDLHGVIPNLKKKKTGKNNFFVNNNKKGSQIDFGNETAIRSECEKVVGIKIYHESNVNEHVILQRCRARDLLGSQIPVTTGGFELRISCI